MSVIAPGTSARRTFILLCVMVVGMFGFGFAMVPIYDIFCDITGLNGKTGVVQADQLSEEVDTSRLVTVEFLGTVNSGLQWEFRPTQRTLKVHPGKVYETSYSARNRAVDVAVGQAVPSVAPAKAAAYFNKTECFCFTEQRFEPGEQREMPVRFVVETGLPAEVSTITLSYTFFNTDKRS